MDQSEILGRYRILGPLGAGGMGQVLLAETHGAEGWNRKVVIKQLHAHLRGVPELEAAFRTEAAVAQRLQHGNLTQVLDFGIDPEGVPFLVLEHVDGLSLSELLARRGPLPVGAALAIVERVAEALEYAHGFQNEAGAHIGVVHRDVTPGNVLVSRAGLVKLTDFGLAKFVRAPSMTLPGTVKGTMGYLAPEQARGVDVDGRADQFSLGVVLYELLSGTNPLALPAGQALSGDGGSVLPRPSGWPNGLWELVARATQTEPDARYARVQDFGEALVAWRQGQAIRVLPEELGFLVTRALGETRAAPKAVRFDPRASGSASTQVAIVRPAARRGWPARRKLAVTGVGLVLLAGIAAAGLWRVREAGVRPALAGLEVGRSADVEVPSDAPAAASAEVPGAARPLAVRSTPLEEPAPASGAGARPTSSGTTSAKAGGLPGASGAKHAAHAPPGASPARLKVNVLPWAEVRLDGALVGRTPLSLEIPAGRHRVELVNSELARKSDTSIDAPPGGEISIQSW